MGKKTIKVCELCGKESCSGKEFFVTDKHNTKKIICESQTRFIIDEEVYFPAVKMFDKKYGQSDVSVTNTNFIKKALNGEKRVPVKRVHFIGCGEFPEAVPLCGETEKLSIPFKQLNKNATTYNNLEEKIEKISGGV